MKRCAHVASCDGGGDASTPAYLKAIYDFLLYWNTRISLASPNCSAFAPVYYYFGRQILVKCFRLARTGAE